MQLVAEGRLRLEADRYVPIGDLTSLAVPETLTALIASRLDGLDPADRALVSDAAVLGQSFTLAGLSAVSGMEEADLEPRLRSLVRRELLTLEADLRSPERGQYAFVQALIREVAYNTLARTDRKVRHLAAARFFEALGTDELAGALAGHYLAARDNAPGGPERDALAGQARLALRGAGERAAALGSHDQALGFFEQALAVTSEPAAEVELLQRVGASATAAGRYDLAESSYHRAIELTRSVDARSGTARAIGSLARSLLTGRRTVDALALLEPASMEFADLAPDPTIIALDGQLARAYLLNGDHRRAVSASEPVLEAAEHADLPEILADTLVTKGTALAWLGRVQEGTGIIEIGERIARSHGLALTLLRALRNRSATLGFDVDANTVRQLADEILTLARRLGERPSIIDATDGLGWCAVLFDGDAEAALDTWAGILQDDLDPADRIPSMNASVVLHAWRGDPVDESLAQLELLAMSVSEPGFRTISLETRGWVAFSAGRLDTAQEEWAARIEASPGDAAFLIPWVARAALWNLDAVRAEAFAEKLDATGVHLPAVELRRLSLQAGRAALAGDAGAVGFYTAVIAGWRQLGQTLEEAFTGIDMATLLDPAEPGVRAAAERSREILVRLKATPFIERLDAALARQGAARSAT
jgi:tetratricopeptide (TPR) repeat protein